MVSSATSASKGVSALEPQAEDDAAGLAEELLCSADPLSSVSDAPVPRLAVGTIVVGVKQVPDEASVAKRGRRNTGRKRVHAHVSANGSGAQLALLVDVFDRGKVWLFPVAAILSPLRVNGDETDVVP